VHALRATAGGGANVGVVMSRLQRVLAGLALLTAGLLSSGCTTTIVLMHLHAKLTEGDPLPCMQLNTVQRALQERCGKFEAGSLVTRDVLASGLTSCPLTVAARDPQFWPVLPELLARGASPESCEQSPLRALAQAQPCPPFERASAEQIAALRWLAQADARAVSHDVMRVLSCPGARTAGLSSVLDGWLADGLLPAGQIAFSPLGALHPGHLRSRLAQQLEAQGHVARAALSAYDGRLPAGFDLALQTADLAALDWWLARAPELVNQVPPSAGGQLPWRPLARVLTPSYLPDAARQRQVVEYLLARGADPWLRLPHEPMRTVVSLARELKSPVLALLDPQRPLAPPAAHTLASTATR
jgi:hypothetical protein